MHGECMGGMQGRNAGANAGEECRGEFNSPLRNDYGGGWRGGFPAIHGWLPVQQPVWLLAL